SEAPRATSVSTPEWLAPPSSSSSLRSPGPSVPVNRPSNPWDLTVLRVDEWLSTFEPSPLRGEGAVGQSCIYTSEPVWVAGHEAQNDRPTGPGGTPPSGRHRFPGPEDEPPAPHRVPV